VVTRLYREASGRVVGVRVKTKDGTARNYRATKGVLLSMGGLGVNLEGWAKYSPVCKDLIKKAKKARSVYPLTVTGDGYTLVNEIDAYLYPVPPSYAANGVELSPDGFAVAHLYYRWSEQGAICVNANGLRFADETSFSDFYITKKFKTEPGLWQLVIFDDSVRQTPQGQLWAQPIIDKVLANGHNTVQQANTIEELAEKFGIPGQAVRKTVDAWNSLVEAGGPDQLTGRTKMGAKIVKPPFWGFEMVLQFGNSKAGCKTNPQAQVIDDKGDVIPGLYVAGEMSYFQVHGSARVHIPGGCNGQGANFGRIAARSIAKEKVQA
jgi:fumarate reductase flavoprotein subunit